MNYEWHYALNQYNGKLDEFKHWMYEGKRAAEEHLRLVRLFKREHEYDLPKIHQQCSCSKPVDIKDNFLTCAIGVRCSECPHLKALEQSKMSQDEVYEAKSWTCISHIMHELGSGKFIDTSMGYILTEDDKVFWNNVHQSMSSGE